MKGRQIGKEGNGTALEKGDREESTDLQCSGGILPFPVLGPKDLQCRGHNGRKEGKALTIILVQILPGLPVNWTWVHR